MKYIIVPKNQPMRPVIAYTRGLQDSVKLRGEAGKEKPLVMGAGLAKVVTAWLNKSFGMEFVYIKE